MKRPLRRLAVSTLALLLAAPAAAQKIIGQILGGPPDKVRIELAPLFQDYRQGVRRLQGEAVTPLAAASPRPDGTFEIAAPGPGFYLVTVRAEGQAPLQYPLAPLVDDTGLPPARLGPASPASPWKPAAAPGPDRKTTRQAGLEVRDVRGRPVPRALVRHGSGLPLGLTGPEGRLTLPLPAEPEPLVVETEDGRIASTTSPEGEAAGRPWVVTLPVPEVVTGRVLSAGGRAPLPGALVWSSVTDPRTALAGPDGSVRLQVEPGRTKVFVQAAAPGHAPARFQVFRRPEDGGLEPVTLLLAPAAVLTGQVVDAEGRPVAGAAVRASPKGHLFQDEAGEDPAWSGPDGRFRLSRLVAGATYGLSVRREGFAPGAAIANAAAPGAAAAPLRIVLSRGRTVRGQVLDDARRPVAGAQVRLVSVDSGSYQPLTGHQALEVSADAQGGFELEDVLAGRFDLAARAKGFVMALVPGVEVRDGAGPQDLGAVTLPRGAALAGQVVDPHGAPVAGADVLYRRADNRYGYLRHWIDNLEENRATTDPEGRFRIDGLPETQGSVLVRRSGYLPSILGPVAVPAPEPLRIELQAAGALSGRVVGPRGEPVPDALLTGSDQGGVRNPAMGRTDGEGRFRLEDLTPGPVELMIQAPGYRTRTWRGEAPEQGEAGPAEILLERGATLRGRVTDADGTPVAGVRVRANLAVDGLTSSAGAQTDGDGRYVLTGLGAGPHGIEAYGDEGRRAYAKKEIRPGTNSLDLAFEPGFEVSGWVRDERGEPVAGAGIQPSYDSSSETVSAGDGSFRIPRARAGTVGLTVRKSGFVPLQHDVEVDGEPVRGIDLRLARGGTIAGRLLGATPDDLSGITVQASSNLSGARGTVAPDGRYRIPDVAPGEWAVLATLPSGRQVRGTARLALGEDEAVLDLDVSGDLSLSGRLSIDGAPLALAQVLVKPQEPGGFGGSARPTADGRFRISRLPRGSYVLAVLFIPAPSVEMVYERPVELTSDQEVSLEISTGSVQGRLLAPDGTPVTDTQVTLKGTAGEWSVLSEPRLDSQGRFHMPGLAAGTYQVHLRHDGTGEARPPFEVAPGETAQVDLVLAAPLDQPEEDSL